MRRPAQNDRDAGPGSWSPWKEGPLVFVAGALAAAASFWPLPLHLTSRISTDLGDPTLQAWQVAWGGRALLTQPLHYFESNTFSTRCASRSRSPTRSSGTPPAGLVGHGVSRSAAPLNLLFLFAYGLACAGAYLLARELGLPRRGALVGAAVFGFAPIRLAESSHLHILSSGGIPLTIFLLLRGYRRRSPRNDLCGLAGGYVAREPRLQPRPPLRLRAVRRPDRRVCRLVPWPALQDRPGEWS